MKTELHVPPQSKEIPGFDGFYRVDVFGQVWTCRAFGNIKNRRGAWKKKASSGPNSDGYPIILLVLNGKQKEYRIHRLVLETFRGPCPPGMVSRHFPDRNPMNISVTNLQWGTPKQNTHDRNFQGTDQKGQRNPRAKLTWEKVREIRKLYHQSKIKSGRAVRFCQKTIAGSYGVSNTLISGIVRGLCWREE